MLHSGPLRWGLLFSTFADCQILICDTEDRLLAFGHAVPFRWDGSPADLPRTIRDIISWAEQGRRLGAPPNTFSALPAVVDERQQGRGLSGRIIEER
jgi:hypothetical protein